MTYVASTAPAGDQRFQRLKHLGGYALTTGLQTGPGHARTPQVLLAIESAENEDCYLGILTFSPEDARQFARLLTEAAQAIERRALEERN